MGKCSSRRAITIIRLNFMMIGVCFAQTFNTSLYDYIPNSNWGDVNIKEVTSFSHLNSDGTMGYYMAVAVGWDGDAPNLGMQIIDASDPNDLKHYSDWFVNSENPYDMKMYGDYLYLANNERGDIDIYDVSDMDQADFFTGPLWKGAIHRALDTETGDLMRQAHNLFIADDVLYVATHNNRWYARTSYPNGPFSNGTGSPIGNSELFVYNLKNNAINPQLIAKWDLPYDLGDAWFEFAPGDTGRFTHMVHDVFVQGNRIYIAAGSEGLFIGDFEATKNVDGELTAWTLLADYTWRIQYSIWRDPALAPTGVPIVSSAHSVWATNDDAYIFVSDENGWVTSTKFHARNASSSVRMFDLSILSSSNTMKEIGGTGEITPKPKMIYDVLPDDDGGTVYQSSAGVDISTTIPSIASSMHNIMIKGDRLYISYYAKGLRVLDISDLTVIKEISYFDTPTELGENDPGSEANGSWGVTPFTGRESVVYLSDKDGVRAINNYWAGNISKSQSVTVQANERLNIAAGATIKFAPNINLTIEGTMVAAGEISNMVKFTDATGTGASQWAGIKFKPGASGNSVIDYAIIEYADTAISVSATTDTIHFTNSILRYINDVGIYATGTSLHINGNTLISPGKKGIYLLNVTNTTVWNNDISGYSAGNFQYTYGILLVGCDDGNTVVSHNSIHDGGVYPEYGEGIRTINSDVDFLYNDIYNTDKGVIIAGSPYPNFGYNYVHDNRYGLQITSGNPFFLTNSGHGHNVISGHNKDGFYIHTYAATTLGWYNNPGLNDIMNNNSGNSYINQIYTFSIYTIPAQKNWWGMSDPSSAVVYRGSGDVLHYYTLSNPVDPFAGDNEQPGALGKGVLSPESQLLADAQALTDQGDLTGAMGLFEELVADYPETAEAQMGLQLYARVLFKANQFHKKAAYFKAMSNSPNHPLRALARIFWIDAALENGEYPNVIKYFRAQINRNKGTIIEADAYLQMGQIFLDYADDFEAAQAEQEKLASNFPDSDFIHLLGSFMDEYRPGSPLAKRTQARASATSLEEEVLPEKYSLSSYPNPFNPTATIAYSLPKDVQVRLVVYDMLGREVIRLRDGFQTAGYKQVLWGGRDKAGQQMPSGIYIARIVAPGYTKSLKMILLK